VERIWQLCKWGTSTSVDLLAEGLKLRERLALLAEGADAVAGSWLIDLEIPVVHPDQTGK
jgi:hypothetical protein